MGEVDPGADENRSCGLWNTEIAKNGQDSQAKRRARRVAGDHNFRGMNRFVHSSRRWVRQVDVCISVSVSSERCQVSDAQAARTSCRGHGHGY